MAEMRQPGRAFAIQDEVQYQPAKTVAEQHVLVRDQDGKVGILPCHASQRLDRPSSGIGRLVVVVHGALRDSDQYFAHAQAAAGDVGSSAVIVAPQFLANVDAEALAGAASETLFWDVEGWKGGEAALGPAPISSFTAMDGLLEQLTEWGRRRDGRKLSVVIIGNSAGGQYVNNKAHRDAAPRTSLSSAASRCALLLPIRPPTSILIMNVQSPYPMRLVSIDGAMASRDRPPTSIAVRNRAWSAISHVTSLSCSALKTATAPRFCSR
jgi:hypothetical protein